MSRTYSPHNPRSPRLAVTVKSAFVSDEVKLIGKPNPPGASVSYVSPLSGLSMSPSRSFGANRTVVTPAFEDNMKYPVSSRSIRPLSPRTGANTLSPRSMFGTNSLSPRRRSLLTGTNQ
jgi:hypothetical protein